MKHLILSVLSIGLLALAAFSTKKETATSAKSPNIVVFIADDLGWEDSAPYGNPVVRTPNLSRIATEGMRFDNFFLTASSCSPSRSSILSGRYPHNTGAMNLHENMAPSVQLFPELLQDVGYYSMLVGKSHGTNLPAVKKKFDWLDMVDWSKPWTMGEMWLEALAKRPKDKPFFLWAASIDPHRPYNQGTYAYHHKPEEVILPPYYPDIPEMRKELAEYYDEISRFDQHVGLVLEALEKSGELDNTIIVVMTDNGRPFPQAKTRVNAPGVKSPLLIRYPPLVKKGSHSASLLSAIDLAPTLLEMAGAKPLTDGQGVPFTKLFSDPAAQIRPVAFAEHNWHGYRAFERAVITPKYLYIKNWLPDLRATPPGDPGREPAYQRMWQLYEADSLDAAFSDTFITPRDSTELFDLTQDIHTMHTLIHNPKYKQEAVRLDKMLADWMKKTGDFFPGRDKLKPDESDRRTGQFLKKEGKGIE